MPMLQSLIAFAVLASPPAQQSGLHWTKVAEGSKQSISGIVRWGEEAGQPRFLVVHDNKKPEEPKMSWMVSTGANAWKLVNIEVTDPKKLAADSSGATQLKDLESICRVPDKPDQFFSIGDKGPNQGWVYQFQIKGTGSSAKAEIIDAFQVPDVLSDNDYEAFDVAVIGGKTVAVWADRGSSSRGAWLTVAPFNLAKRPTQTPFEGSSKFIFSAPWPTHADARSVSDLRVSKAGYVYVSSASDPGDEGPFDSAVYIAAQLPLNQDVAHIVSYPTPIPVAYTPGYKIEAIDFDLTGKELIFATDDESMGASIAWFQK